MDRKLRFSLFIGLLIIVLACLCVFTGSADDGTPDGLFSWYDETINATCYVWPDGSGDCYCACEEEYDGRIGEIQEVVSTPPSVQTPTDGPISSPTPEPTEQSKASCNRGLGNGSEDCDPGNSGGRPGSAGEDNE